MNPQTPHPPPQGTPQPGRPSIPLPLTRPNTVNPDPKAHPIHAPIPQQPIHQGTDPKRPVSPDES